MSIALSLLRRPYVELDFTRMAFDPRVSFSRSSTAARYKADKSLEFVSSNVPRIDHDPATGAVRGLLLEPQATNVITYSQEFDNSAWTKTNSAITANAVAAPDGTTTADLITDNSTSGYHLAYYSTTIVDGAVYARSVFVKKATARYAAFGVAAVLSSGANTWIFDFDTGTFTATGTSGAGQKATQLANGWWRIELYNVSTTSNNSRIAVGVSSGPNRADTSYAGSGALSVYVWGAQFELGSFASSYIPTTTTSVTRAVDAASFTVPERVVRLVTIYYDGTTASQTVTPGATYNIPTGTKQIVRIRGYYA